MRVKSVTKRDLNQHTAATLALVTDDDDVVVTERGLPRWRVSALRHHDSALARLERHGTYSPPLSDPSPWPPADSGQEYKSAQVDDLLNDVRGDH